jgi:hypothetical protein
MISLVSITLLCNSTVFKLNYTFNIYIWCLHGTKFIITMFQIHTFALTRLRDGEGFFDHCLDPDQRSAVFSILEHKRPLTPFLLIGPPGTGKTRVLDEVLLQVIHYHREENPCDAA